MYIRDLNLFKFSSSNAHRLQTVAVWISGFLLGCLVAGAAEPPVSSLMLRAFAAPMSIDGLLTAYFLPFLFAATAAYLKFGRLLLIMCFIKAFSFAFLACCSLACMDAAWLLVPVLLVSDVYNGILLVWMNLSVPGHPNVKLSYFVIPLILTALVAGFDFFRLSPFLAAIFA